MIRAWLLLIVGVAGLVSLREAYLFTYEPAPSVRVRWRDGTSDSRRSQLERKYRLVNPEAPQGLSYSYALLDTSRTNIMAMIKDPEVGDTGDIDREKFEVPFWTAAYSRESMWVADRIPVVRQPAVRRTLAALLVAMILLGLRRIVTAVDWARRARAAMALARRVESALKHG
jgi:hypothetical protein